MDKSSQQFVWNGIDLDALRQIMDKPADQAIEAIFKSKSMEHLRSILVDLAQNDSVISKELPKPMLDFVNSELNIHFTPEEISLFNQTHEIWKEKGTKFILILMFRALPYTYMAEKPANVLRMTKLLKTQPERRIFETAQFVFDVMDQNWWDPEKRGILTALKVRIMHAAMRQVILDNTYGEEWNEAWGKPISQEDLVATNQVFSLEFFKGMALLGDPLTPQEQEAWFYTWKTIGRIMGVQENLQSKDVEEAWSLQHAVYDHLFRDKTVSGVILTKALVETLNHFHLPLKLILLLMKRMLADDQFPDCFERMLGPSYRDAYPELFINPQTENEKVSNDILLREDLHTNLKEYHQIIKFQKGKYQKKKPDSGLGNRIIGVGMQLLSRFFNRKNLVEVHHGKLREALLNKGSDNTGKEIGEEIILDAMSALSGIMIGILSLHFREGKQTGFRIPKTLRANWLQTGKRKKLWIWNIKIRS